jgi:beta-glucuronidase
MEKHDKPENRNISVVQDPLADIVDLVSFNQYTGWYGSTLEVRQNRMHGDKNQRFTENIRIPFRETLKMIDKVWFFLDSCRFSFATQVLPGIQTISTKRTVSSDGNKKKHLCIKIL